jgi:uncharacterized membrane protein YjjP (DUF1212 family)
VQKESKSELQEVGLLLLEVGAYLMSSGACSNRIRITVDRIADAFDLDAELLVTNRALMISISDTEKKEHFSSVKRTPPHGVNFKLVSGISIMSWRIVAEKWTTEQIKAELSRLVALPQYPRLMVLALVALAGAAFCRLLGGNYIEMASTYVATFLGLFIHQQAHKANFNPYLCVLFASLLASMVSGLGFKLGFSNTLEHSLAASILFLIPGVPLINAFTDIIDGNILNGVVRGINAFVIIFMVALGLLSATLIYRI